MKDDPDMLLSILLEIEKLTNEEREALFVALYEQYQWAPPATGPPHHGVSTDDFGRFAESFTIKDYDVILLRCGSEALPLLHLIRSNTGLSPAWAKALLSSLPAVVKERLGQDEASKLCEDLLACGAEAEICESSHTQERLEELKNGLNGRKP